MSIRFNVKRGTIMPTRGKIFVRLPDREDWGPSEDGTQRFADRGLLTSPVSEVEDWGRLPKANT